MVVAAPEVWRSDRAALRPTRKSACIGALTVGIVAEMEPERSAFLFEQFAEAADLVARARPEVDYEVARELLFEAAAMLHNGLVLDELDDHDYAAVVADLSVDLIAVDPAVAVRRRAQATRGDAEHFHDPDAVAATHLAAAATLQL